MGGVAVFNKPYLLFRTIEKISYIYLFHRGGFIPNQVARIMVYNQPIKIQAMVGATLVPMAVPISWRKCWQLNMKTLNMRKNDKKIIKKNVVSFGWGLSLGLSRAYLNFYMPFFKGIL